MDDVEEEFADLVRNQLEKLETTAFAMEVRHDLPQDAIRSVIRKGDKRARPSLSRVKEICDALGLEFYVGLPRDWHLSAHERMEMTEYANIPLYDVRLAAGSGASNGRETVVDWLAFKRSWLQKVGVSPRNARLARIMGDSMEPLLQDQDLVLIDVSRRTVPARPRKPGKRVRADLYAVLDGGEARVKRVEHSSPGRLILHSDNHALYPPEIREGGNASSLGIIGKVIWWGHTVEEN